MTKQSYPNAPKNSNGDDPNLPTDGRHKAKLIISISYSTAAQHVGNRRPFTALYPLRFLRVQRQTHSLQLLGNERLRRLRPLLAEGCCG